MTKELEDKMTELTRCRDLSVQCYDELNKSTSKIIEMQRERITELEAALARVKLEIIDNPVYSSQLAQAVFAGITEALKGGSHE